MAVVRLARLRQRAPAHEVPAREITTNPSQKRRVGVNPHLVQLDGEHVGVTLVVGWDEVLEVEGAVLVGVTGPLDGPSGTGVGAYDGPGVTEGGSSAER